MIAHANACLAAISEAHNDFSERANDEDNEMRGLVLVSKMYVLVKAVSAEVKVAEAEAKAAAAKAAVAEATEAALTEKEVLVKAASTEANAAVAKAVAAEAAATAALAEKDVAVAAALAEKDVAMAAALAEKDVEITELTRQVTELDQAATQGPTDALINEMIKEKRDLEDEVDTLKMDVGKLEAKEQELKLTLEAKERELKARLTEKTETRKKVRELEDEIRKLKSAPPTSASKGTPKKQFPTERSDGMETTAKGKANTNDGDAGESKANDNDGNAGESNANVNTDPKIAQGPWVVAPLSKEDQPGPESKHSKATHGAT